MAIAALETVHKHKIVHATAKRFNCLFFDDLMVIQHRHMRREMR